MVIRFKYSVLKPKALTVVFNIDFTQYPPKTLSEALSFAHCHQAMTEEYDALIKNPTWQLTDPPSDSTIIGCKWVYTVKNDPNNR
ncbi:hypothetical protein AHAS_Ahas01G0160000 [Arachis hypogaea]